MCEGRGSHIASSHIHSYSAVLLDDMVSLKVVAKFSGRCGGGAVCCALVVCLDAYLAGTVELQAAKKVQC